VGFAGTVDEHIYPLPPLHCLRYQQFARLGIAYIRLQRNNRSVKPIT
jgi:hypothetical protein